MPSAAPPSHDAPPPPDATPGWSVVVPAYNEAGRITPTLRAILDFFSNRGEPLELIVVDDGSTDGTADLVARDFPECRLLHNPGNRGKGYSVRAGLQAARGRRILFSDADLSTPIDELERLEQALDTGADLAIASRALEQSRIEKHQAWWREGAGRCFNLLVRLVSGLPYRDTQCGFKAYRAEAAREIARRQQSEGWAFDVEHLRLARALGYQVRELPVRWINSENSRLKFFTDAPRMLIDVLRIRLSRIPD